MTSVFWLPPLVFFSGYAAGATPVAWLLVRRRHGVDLRQMDGNTGALGALRVGGVRTAAWSLLLEAVKGGLVGIVARLLIGESWLTALAIAGCVVGDAFPVLWRRSGRGVVPLVSGLVVALPLAGMVTGIVALATVALRRQGAPLGVSVIAIAVPLGLVLGTHSVASLIPAAIIVATLLLRMVYPARGRPRLLRPGSGVVIEQPR